MRTTTDTYTITDVDSFHPQAHPSIRTLELHGYLRSAVCTTCRTEYDRQLFQNDLASLNPAWSDFLNEMLASGALTTENPEERRRLGLKTNPDGDVDVPGVDYATFRYPACPSCLANPGKDKEGKRHVVEVDEDGAWKAGNSTAGILKPNVIMFGESIPDTTKVAAEKAIDEAARVLVLGSSLATYSAWRLVKRAREQHWKGRIKVCAHSRGDVAESCEAVGTEGNCFPWTFCDGETFCACSLGVRYYRYLSTTWKPCFC
jgi:NAD-dependent deacetylase sirtuin 4